MHMVLRIFHGKAKKGAMCFYEEDIRFGTKVTGKNNRFSIENWKQKKSVTGYRDGLQKNNQTV